MYICPLHYEAIHVYSVQKVFLGFIPVHNPSQPLLQNLGNRLFCSHNASARYNEFRSVNMQSICSCLCDVKNIDVNAILVSKSIQLGVMHLTLITRYLYVYKLILFFHEKHNTKGSSNSENLADSGLCNQNLVSILILEKYYCFPMYRSIVYKAQFPLTHFACLHRKFSH